MDSKVKKIVTIGGGSGHSVLLSAINILNNVDITAIVSTADSGGSSGRLREEYGIIPPGDVLKCLIALSPNRDKYGEFLLKRIETNNGLKDHSVGNLLLTSIAREIDNFAEAIDTLADILKSRGKVLTVADEVGILVAELIDGTKIIGESAIDRPRIKNRPPINKLSMLSRNGNPVIASPRALEAVGEADFIIIGPGDLYTSLIPNLLAQGMMGAIKKTSAKIIFILNIYTKAGETDNYKASDFIKTIELYLGRKIDFFLANQSLTNVNDINLVEIDELKDFKVKVFQLDLSDDKSPELVHDQHKLSFAINRILNSSG